MRLGEPTAERAECSALDVALDETQQALTKMISLLDAGWLEQLNAAEKISFWQKFETFRNRLPLIDHALIADAETTDLAGEYCFSNLKMLMTRRLQLSPAEAAARVRAAAAVGPRVSTQDEAEWPVLPQLAAAQRAGEVGTEQVQIVARAMQKLSRPDLDPDQVAAIQQQLVEHAQELGPKDLRLVADRELPGCDHAPQWCDRHHVLDWILGGRTDLENLTLLCRYHHTHFLQKGWSCRINADGLPEWIPPRWIDPQQRPQLNGRIRRLHAQRQLSRQPAKAA
jgi:Domain of unknown function (DUF222)